MFAPRDPSYVFVESSSMAFRISPIVAFVIPPEFNPCLVFTHCISHAPSLVLVDVFVLISFVFVAMIIWSSLGIGLFNLQLLVSKIGRWFFKLVLLILLKALLDFGHLFLLITPFMTLHMIMI